VAGLSLAFIDAGAGRCGHAQAGNGASKDASKELNRMSERKRPHNGRSLDGHRKVRQVDVADVLEDPNGVDYIRDDVRLGGAVEDTGPCAGQDAKRVGRLIQDNKDNVNRVTGRRRSKARKG
jgi:hypothetical protein